MPIIGEVGKGIVCVHPIQGNMNIDNYNNNINNDDDDSNNNNNDNK